VEQVRREEQASNADNEQIAIEILLGIPGFVFLPETDYYYDH